MFFLDDDDDMGSGYYLGDLVTKNGDSYNNTGTIDCIYKEDGRLTYLIDFGDGIKQYYPSDIRLHSKRDCIKCECGSSKVFKNYKRNVIHSSWCPKYKEESV